MENIISIKDLLASIIFTAIGIVMFAVSFIIFDKMTPGNLSQEILEKQNLAAAIFVAALIIGISIIVGLAIH